MLAGSGAALLASPLAPSPARADPARRALVLGHRGACAWRPEHTLASYARAIADGADFVEPDLVATRDGVLVARHENAIGETTDVATRPEFAARRCAKVVDGTRIEGWFTEDFTLAELQTLRARERLTGEGLRRESHAFDGQFRICTLAEIAEFVAAEAATRGRSIGLIPELKHSTYFAGIGLPLEERFCAELEAHPYLRSAPVIVQSFEVANLKALRTRLAGRANVQLMQLIDDDAMVPADVSAAGGRTRFAQMLTPSGLAAIAGYAEWVAPWTRQLIPLDADGRLGQSSGVVAAAHRAGLRVGCYTFRPENRFLPADCRDGRGDNARNEAGSVAEMRRYLAEGIDGLFTDDPALGRRAVDGG